MFSSVTRILCCELSFDREGVVQHIHSVPHTEPLAQILTKVFPVSFVLIPFIPMITAFLFYIHQLLGGKKHNLFVQAFTKLSFSAVCVYYTLHIFQFKTPRRPKNAFEQPTSRGRSPWSWAPHQCWTLEDPRTTVFFSCCLSFPFFHFLT